jgi:hypothetical protein
MIRLHNMAVGINVAGQHCGYRFIAFHIAAAKRFEPDVPPAVSGVSALI